MGCHVLVLYGWPTEQEDDLHFSLPPPSLVQNALLSSPRPPTPCRLLRYGQERSLSFPGSAGVLPLRFGYHGDRLHGNPQLAFSRMGLDPSPPAGALPLRPWHLGRCVGGHSGSFLASTRLPWQEQRLLRVNKSPKVSIPPARSAPVGGPRMPHQSRPRSQNSHVEINCLWLLVGDLPCWLHVWSGSISPRSVSL